MEEKLTDVEGHSRRNNVRIYRVPGGAEKDFPTMALFLRENLNLLEDTWLQIERAPRALGRQPPADAQPRSIVVKFPSFTTKEQILRQGWQMRGFSWQGKQISFDNDYTPQVLQMRREYTEIRKVLKDRDIFKTLYPLVWRCSMRIEWRYTTLLRKCRKRSQREDSRCSPSATQTPSWTRFRECLGREVAGARADAIPKREEGPTFKQKLQSFRRKDGSLQSS